ncbi:MAG: PilZ domain-containing protein [Spirochaetales bacterium]|nr:PilZ domain-containing protein [Spirochaetales bacterium]
MKKRHYHRLLLVTDVEYNTEDAGSMEKSRSKDISQGGICITTSEKPLPMGKICNLRISMPESKEQIIVKGRVMWNREYETGAVKLYDNGLEFIDLEEEFAEIIKEYSIGSVENQV